MTLLDLQFRLEAAAARVALMLIRALPPATASNIGGAVARGIGPLLPVSNVADANLRLALPGLDVAARRRIVRGVWDNLGRTVAELPHLPGLRPTAAGPGWDIVGEHRLHDLAASGGPAIFFSGHIGNWEALSMIPNRTGLAMPVFYRAAANPLVDRIIQDLRQHAAGKPLPQFAKGATGARAALAHLRSGGFLGMLVDQKMNDGIPAPLFGHMAMTAPAAAAFALRYRCPLVPGHIERLGPARFRLIVDAPLNLPDTGDRQGDIASLTATVNACLEGWIREHPESWLWLHRRWPKDLTN
jgi:Kdo2-lipid IVA lauroyltransferase/acyltransferase